MATQEDAPFPVQMTAEHLVGASLAEGLTLTAATHESVTFAGKGLSVTVPVPFPSKEHA